MRVWVHGLLLLVVVMACVGRMRVAAAACEGPFASPRLNDALCAGDTDLVQMVVGASHAEVVELREYLSREVVWRADAAAAPVPVPQHVPDVPEDDPQPVVRDVDAWEEADSAGVQSEFAYEPEPEGCAVLAELYEATGSLWHGVSGWGNQTNCCTWTGVSCMPDADRNYVTRIELPAGVGMQGTLPASLSTLPKLNLLQISDEPGLNGTLPALPAMTDLRVTNANLEGTLGDWVRADQPCGLYVLDVSHNRFSAVSDTLRACPNLSSLYVGYNELTEFPPVVMHLPAVIDLRLSHNPTMTGPVPRGVSDLAIEYVELSYTRLSGPLPCFPAVDNLGQMWDTAFDSITTHFFERCSHLTELWVERVPLATIEDGMQRMTNLTRIALSNTKLGDLSALDTAIRELQRLEKVAILNAPLTTVFSMHTCPPALQYVGLSSDTPWQLPPDFCFCAPTVNLNAAGLTGTIARSTWECSTDRITYLDLAHNDVGGEVALHKMTGLVRVELGHSQFTGLSGVENLLSLRYFEAGNNRMVGTIPGGYNLPLINHYHVDSNQFTDMVPFECVGAVPLSLDISDNPITWTLPASLCECVFADFHFDHMDLHGTMPPCLFDNCQALSEADVSSNQLAGPLPETIGNCWRLVVLNVAFNQLTHVPGAMANCTNLQAALLASNHFEDVPSNVLQLPHLQYMDVSDNRLTNLRPEFLYNHNIVSLYLSHNMFEGNFPPSNDFVNTHLAYLDMSNNKFRNTDNSFNPTRFTALTALDVSNNELEMLMPYEISIHGATVNQGPLTVLRLSNNKITGSAHDLQVRQFYPQMASLDISRNHFDAEPIPSDWGSLDKLKSLNVQQSGLSGVKNMEAASGDGTTCVHLSNSAEKVDMCFPDFLQKSDAMSSPGGNLMYSCHGLEGAEGHPYLQVAIGPEYYTTEHGDQANCLCDTNAFRAYHGESHECRACVVNGECPGGTDEAVIYALPDYYGVPVDASPPWAYQRCDHQGVCAPEPSQQCADGHWGRMCSKCEDGWYQQGNQKCIKCGAAANVLVPVAGTVLLVVVIAVLFRAEPRAGSAGTVKIALFHVQTLKILPLVAPQLPLPWLRLSSSTSTFSLHIEGIECFVGPVDFYTRFIITMLLPLVCFALIFVIYLVGRGSTPRINRAQWRQRSMRVYIVLVYASYYAISAVIDRSLTCKPEVITGNSFFQHSPATPCITHKADVLRGVAWTLFVVYVIGIPVSIFVYLFRHRAELGKASTLRVWGFLYSSVEPRFWWYEALTFLRKSGIAFAIFFSYSIHGKGTAPLVVVAVLLISVVSLAWMRPWVRTMDNHLEFCSLIVLSLTYAAVLSFAVDREILFGTMIIVVIVLLNVAFVCAAAYMLVGKHVRVLVERVWTRGHLGPTTVALTAPQEGDGVHGADEGLYTRLEK